MQVLAGISDGAVLQRDSGDLCRVDIDARFTGEPVSSIGILNRKTESEWELSGIPTGGPYTIIFRDAESSATFRDIYVGDVWLLAGQSNMEGAGRMTPEDDAYVRHPHPMLRALYMDDRWDSARPQLHQLWLSPDPAHQAANQRYRDSIRERKLTVLDHFPAPQRRGVGPGLYFAQEMHHLSGGVPQGLIPCAVGGAPIEMWLPTEDGSANYYTAARRRLRLAGNHIRGVFWSQGEGNPNWAAYPDQIRRLRSDLVQHLHCGMLPFVQVQSFRLTLPAPPETAYVWSRFRDMQRTMPAFWPDLATIAANDLELDDCIHLSSDSQKKIGARAAKAMHYLIAGIGRPEPDLDSIRAEPDEYLPFNYTLRIKYRNVTGCLKASGVPSGFTLRKIQSGQDPSLDHIQRIYPAGDEVVIRTELALAELQQRELWYGWGNSFYCNITDEADRAIPAMGPIALDCILSPL